MAPWLIVKISYDAHGTPGIWGRDAADAYRGLGWTHGRHRPLQSLIFGAAGRGALCRYLLPREELQQLDTLVAQLDLAARGAAAEKHLKPDDARLLHAYLRGFEEGLRWGGQPWEARLLLTRFPPLTVASTLSSLMLSAYLGLSEGQERMERALLQCLQAGADATLLERMFAPHLEGWDPALLRDVQAADVCIMQPPLVAAGGSNAWAVTAERSASRAPMLCGDPHLQVNQLPALFFEVRARVGDDYWLGASIPGLPGIAVGRNQTLAWSGTFSCADNVDFAVETLEDGAVQRGDAWVAPTRRDATVARRGKAPLQLSFAHTGRGVLLNADHTRGRVLAKRWAAAHAPAEALGAYMQLPLTGNAAEAARVLNRAHTLSLHWVLADRSGDVVYKQAGSIPRRTQNWSGLYPVEAQDGKRWSGLYAGADLPRAQAVDGMVVSANEARLAPDGGVLATLAQPPYRQRRIEQLLRERTEHTVQSMQRIQLDVHSAQGMQLRSVLLRALPDGPMAQALRAWDGDCGPDSVGAHAFAYVYAQAQRALATQLGRHVWDTLLACTEARVWFGAALDGLLRDEHTWTEAAVAPALHTGLQTCAAVQPLAWGDAQQVEFKHLVLGDLPRWCGLSRGPYALPGTTTTVSQGTRVPALNGEIVVAPAYRMVCDLAEDALHTAIPGGIDGSFLSSTYTCWLDGWRAGEYHRIAPPDAAEGVVVNIDP